MKTCNECGVVVEVAVCGRNVTLCHTCLRKLSGEPDETYTGPPLSPNPWPAPWSPDPQYVPCSGGPLRYISGGGTQV